MTKSESNQPVPENSNTNQEKRGGRRVPNRYRYRNRNRNRVQAEPAAPTWVYVGNLASEVTEDLLREFFSSEDRELIDVSITKNQRGQRWGKANFAHEEQALSALELNGEKLAGAPVIVEPLKHAPRAKAAASVKTQEINEGTNDLNEAVLFVGNLAQDLTEANLENQFKPHGNVVSVKIINRTQRSWATVEFATKEEAAAALAALDGAEFAGKPIAVRIWRRRPVRAVRKPSETGPTSEEHELDEAVLFVGNLGLDLTEADLEDRFKEHGTVVSVKLAKTRRWATVEFENKEEAAAAIASLDGSQLSDNIIAVRIYKKPQRRLEKPAEVRLPQRQVGKPAEESPLIGPKLFVGNIAKTITREELQNSFEDHGEVVKVAFPGSRKYRTPRWAIVEFATQVQADDAIVAMHGVELGGLPLKVEALRNPPKKKAPRKQQNARRDRDAPVSDEPRRQGRARSRVLAATDASQGNVRKRQPRPKRVVTNPDCHVYVANVGFKVSEEELKSYLSSFGDVSSIESLKSVKGRRWATVEMSSAVDAQNLIAEANNVDFHGRTLVVRLNSQVTGAAPEEPAQTDE